MINITKTYIRYGNKYDKSSDLIYSYNGINEEFTIIDDLSYYSNVSNFIKDFNNLSSKQLTTYSSFDINKIISNVNKYNSSNNVSGVEFKYTNERLPNSYLSEDDYNSASTEINKCYF